MNTMTLDEFVALFTKRKIAVHVHNQIEKTAVLSFLKASIFQHSKYDLPFDSRYQYVGVNSDREDINCWKNPTYTGADIIELDEFFHIIENCEESVDEKSILSLL